MSRAIETKQTHIQRVISGATVLGLWSACVAGGGPIARADQITSVSAVASPSLTGVTVVYSRTDGTLWRYAVTGAVDEPLGNGRWPRLSPDGTHLMYLIGNPVVFANAELYTRPITTTQATHVFENSDWIVGSNWTPDSQQIVFDYTCTLYRSAPDGTGLGTMSGADCFDDAPAVNPADTTQLAFHNTNQSVGLVSTSGAGRHFVSNTIAGDLWPTWSPNGQYLSFLRSGPTPTIVNGIYLGKSLQRIKPDGTGLLQLLAVTAPGDKIGYGGAWTEDGRWVIVAATINGVAGVYAVASDGSGTHERLDLKAGAEPDFVGTVTGPIWRVYLSALARP